MAVRKRKPAPPAAPPPESPAGPSYTLHILSDATGNLARHMINAVLTQFPGITLAQNYHLMLDQPVKLRDELKRIKGEHSLVFHAMIEPAMKRIVDETCEKRGIPHYDLTGSLVRFLADWTGTEPINERAALHRVNAGYFKRIDAMEFTAMHDDSQGLDTLALADIVLVGLSRVSKSPTATFLGAQGWKVANVAIAPQTGLPEQIATLREKKVVAFTCAPRLLHDVRSRRIASSQKVALKAGAAEIAYADMRSVIREVMWAEDLYRKHGWPMVDITNHTVEENGTRVLQLLGLEDQKVF